MGFSWFDGLLTQFCGSLWDYFKASHSTTHQKRFSVDREHLKRAMTETPVLALLNFTLPFIIETEACDIGVCAVLMQQGHPIANMSKALGVITRKLSIYEKEFLAVIMAIDKWRQYLQRGPFLITTDHKSLCNLTDQ
jgi:hypothetical protein